MLDIKKIFSDFTKERQETISNTLESTDHQSFRASQLIMGVSAWLAAGFILSFVFISIGELEPYPRLYMSLTAITLCVIYKRTIKSNVFTDQLILSVLVAANLLLGYAISSIVKDWQNAIWVLTIFQTLLYVAFPNYFYRFTSLILILSGFLANFYSYRWYDSIHFFIFIFAGFSFFIWKFEHALLSNKFREYLKPMLYFLPLALMSMLILPLENKVVPIANWYVSTIFLMLPLSFIVYKLTEEILKEKTTRLIFTLLAFFFLYLTRSSPGIAGALFILTLAIYRNEIILKLLGLLFLIFYISSYYYNLDISLLKKSLLLMLTALCLAAFSFAINYLQKRQLHA